MSQTFRNSIIIPAHNAAHYLERSLPALFRSLPADCEVIIVNDGSTDNTASLAAKYAATIINLPGQTGPSAARNVGAFHSKSEILIFLDADVEVHTDTVRLLAESLDSHPEYAAVFGSYDAYPADHHLISLFKNLMHHHVHQNGYQDAQTFWTGCGAIRRSIFQTVGPFRDVSFICVEDIDYGHRLRDAGYRILLQPHIECKHLKRWTLASLIKTDVLHRGIPWTVMMLRRGKIDTDLNVNYTHRISAVLALVSVSSMAASPFFGSILLALAIVALTILIILQRGFYRTLYRHRGWTFAVASIPLHLLYYLYSLTALAAGIVVYIFTRPNSPALTPG